MLSIIWVEERFSTKKLEAGVRISVTVKCALEKVGILKWDLESFGIGNIRVGVS